MPWSWKTTIGKKLAKVTWMNFLDFDDDIIEKQMWKSVAEVLSELWEENFLDLEEKLALDIKHLENTILSTSGSVPLRPKAMNHLRTIWKSIYIDIPVENIKKRLERMKVDRIVGMENMTMDEILEYRDWFYKKSFDYSFQNDGLGSKEETFEVFLNFYNSLNLQ